MFEALTYNAQQWALYFEEHESLGDAAERHSKALEMIIYEALDILRYELVKAIEKTGEYDYLPLKERLLEVFDNINMVRSSLRDDSIYFDLEGIAGDTGDLQDGINFAREMIGVSGKRTKQQKAYFWRHFIYEPGVLGLGDEDAIEKGGLMYADTVAWRLQGWKGLAPYWYWLEHGNEDSDLAFPKFGGTNFRMIAEERATALFRSALAQVDLEARNIIYEAAENYLQNPEAYKEFDILGQFYASGQGYLVYVTATRKIGVALPETISGIQRGY